MPKMDIEEIVEERLEMIQTETPGVVTKYDIEDDGEAEYAVISICEEDGDPVCVEFVESFASLDRPDALDQYNEAAAGAGKVLVIVPDSEREKAMDLLLVGSNPAIELISYGVIGLTLLA
jgi:hypothetical protein